MIIINSNKLYRNGLGTRKNVCNNISITQTVITELKTLLSVINIHNLYRKYIINKLTPNTKRNSPVPPRTL